MTKLKDRRTKMSERENVDRISLSLPGGLLTKFDALVEERGFESRSQAIAEMMARELDSHAKKNSQAVMTGTIMLVYEHSRGDLKRRLADIQYNYLAEVISSLHVLLESEHTMEVVLVQGKAKKLRQIANDLITCKGVKSGSMTLTTPVMPPIQYPEEKS